MLWVVVSLVAGAADAAPELSPEQLFARTKVTLGPDGPRMGDDGPRLRGAVFYEYVGRHDLARAFRERQDRLDTWAYVGGQAISVAVLPTMAGGLRFLCPDRERFCHPAFDALFFGGLALMGAGAVTLGVATQLDPDPGDPALHAELAAAYNARLERDLREPEARRDPQPFLIGWSGNF